MLDTVKSSIVTDAGGDATVYLAHGPNSKPHGFLVMLIYTPGTIDTGADLTITCEDSGIPILTVTNAGTVKKFYYPRARLNEVADASEATSGSELIPLRDERIKVVVAQGGNAASGSIEAVYLVDFSY